MIPHRAPTTFALASVLLVSVASARQLHQGDITLAVQQGVIRTGVGVPSLGTFVPLRVFGVTLGAQGVPNFASNPGYDSEPGAFPANGAVGFNITDRLYFWNGSTFVPTAGEVMQLNSGGTVRVSSGGFVAGFTLLAGPLGNWHNHLGMLLQRGAAPSITPGVYMLPLEFFAAGLANSPPHYLVFRSNSTFDPNPAAEFVRTRILPPAWSGDSNGDGRTDFLDLNNVLSEYGQSGQWLIGDVNRDGRVDFLDLNLVLSNYGTAQP